MTHGSLENHYDLIVTGGGPAGMAAAAEAKKAGLSKVLIAERGETLGGVLPQCIHDGFGMTEFKKSMTGPEYAETWRKIVNDARVHVLNDTAVIRIRGGGPYTLTLTGPETGLIEVMTKSVVLATGCRERTVGAVRVPGSRPAGIYTAGAAQYMLNCRNYLPGKSAVILGSGDIGLIMARRLTLEGAKVKMILGEKASGLLRNYIQCVKDFDIPIRFGYTVLSTHGYKRLKGVTIAPLDENGKPDVALSSYVPCDTLLAAVGLIPETELWGSRGHFLDSAGGIPVDEFARTQQSGIFACGNVTRIFDTVDEVTENGKQAGRSAAMWVLGAAPDLRANSAESGQPSLGRKISEDDIHALFSAPEEKSLKTVYCIKCPLGCKVDIRDSGDTLSLTGAGCETGQAYAIAEHRMPVRIVTSTVKIKGSASALLPVKTDRPVPKAAIQGVIELCRRTCAAPPVRMGDVIASAPEAPRYSILASASIT